MAADPVVLRAGRLSPEAAGARIHDLFVEHGRMVYGVCRLLLRDGHEAEDAAQQTFLSAHRSLLGGNLPQEPSAWLSAIARNECRSRIRDRMRAPLPLDEELEHASEGTEHIVGQRAEMAALREAVQDLPDAQREAIVLREFYGLRYDEVGAALGLSAPAVESLLFRARKRLQAQLGPLRLASGGLVVPAALREALVQAIPGFSGSVAVGGGALAAALAKLASAPLAAKLAAVALALGAAGTGVGLVDHGGSTSPPRQAQPELLARGVQPSPAPAPPVAFVVQEHKAAAPLPADVGDASLLASLKGQRPAAPPPPGDEGRPEGAGGSGPAHEPETPESPAAPAEASAPAPTGGESGEIPDGASIASGFAEAAEDGGGESFGEGSASSGEGSASSGEGTGAEFLSSGEGSPDGGSSSPDEGPSSPDGSSGSGSTPDGETVPPEEPAP